MYTVVIIHTNSSYSSKQYLKCKRLTVLKDFKLQEQKYSVQVLLYVCCIT